jgi:lysozyme
MDMNLLVAELKRDEGVRYTPYLDTAHPPNWTVGVGHNLSVMPLPAGWTYPLNDTQVDQLLKGDITIAMQQLDIHLTWWRSLDDVRMRVLINMVFNMGITTLLTFRNTLIDMKSGFYTAASTGMRASLWARQVGQRAQRLADAMSTGVMPS